MNRYMELEVLRNEIMRLEEMLSTKKEEIETLEADKAKLSRELQYFKNSDRLMRNRVNRLQSIVNKQYEELNTIYTCEENLCADLNEAQEAMDIMAEELVRLRQSEYFNAELKKALVDLFEIIGGRNDA